MHLVLLVTGQDYVQRYKLMQFLRVTSSTEWALEGVFTKIRCNIMRELNLPLRLFPSSNSTVSWVKLATELGILLERPVSCSLSDVNFFIAPTSCGIGPESGHSPMCNLSKLVIFAIADGSCPTKQPQLRMDKNFKFLILATADNVCVVKLLPVIAKLVRFLKFPIDEGIVIDKSQS